MIKSRSYDYGQGQGHLGYMIPCWTCLVIVYGPLLRGGGKFFVKIATSVQLGEFMATNRFTR